MFRHPLDIFVRYLGYTAMIDGSLERSSMLMVLVGVPSCAELLNNVSSRKPMFMR